MEYEAVHDEAANDIEDVFQKITEIQDLKNVKMCKELDAALVKFKNSVLSYIDRFEGNIYTSAMIPIVIRIQKIFRQRNKERRQKELKKIHRE